MHWHVFIKDYSVWSLRSQRCLGKASAVSLSGRVLHSAFNLGLWTEALPETTSLHITPCQIHKPRWSCPCLSTLLSCCCFIPIGHLGLFFFSCWGRLHMSKGGARFHHAFFGTKGKKGVWEKRQRIFLLRSLGSMNSIPSTPQSSFSPYVGTLEI